jgi:hypothetical protein
MEGSNHAACGNHLTDKPQTDLNALHLEAIQALAED